MSQILLLNPRRKKRTAKKKTARKSPARKRTTRRATTRKKTAARKTATKRKGAVSMATKKRSTKRKAPRRNPAPKRRRRRNPFGGGSSKSIGGLNFKSALKNIPMATLGMFAAKFGAKKFGDAASETDPTTWNYASYLKGAAGAALAGVLANMLRRGTGQKVLEGGMSLMLYKLVQNEFIVNSTFWSGQLGADEGYGPGMIETDSEGMPYILGQSGDWIPLEGADDYRIPQMYGDTLVTPGPLGDTLVTPGPLGGPVDNMFVRDLLHR